MHVALLYSNFAEIPRCTEKKTDFVFKFHEEIWLTVTSFVGLPWQFTVDGNSKNEFAKPTEMDVTLQVTLIHLVHHSDWLYNVLNYFQRM